MVKGFSHFYPKDDTFPDFSRFPCYSAASSKFWIFARLQKKKKEKIIQENVLLSVHGPQRKCISLNIWDNRGMLPKS